MEGDMNRFKCVVVGDDAVGKTSMLISYATRTFPGNVVPDIFDNYAGCVVIAGIPYSMSLIDTSKQTDSEGLRQHLYEGANVFIVCFSVVRPESMENVEERWLPEIKENYPAAPVILIGTQTDLRDNQAVVQLLRNENRSPLTYAQGVALARRHGAKEYLEASPESQRKLKSSLDRIIASNLSAQTSNGAKRNNSNCKIM